MHHVLLTYHLNGSLRFRWRRCLLVIPLRLPLFQKGVFHGDRQKLMDKWNGFHDMFSKKRWTTIRTGAIITIENEIDAAFTVGVLTREHAWPVKPTKISPNNPYDIHKK